MAFVKLAVNGDAYQNVDQIGLTEMSPAVFDGYVTESTAEGEQGVTVKRPGLKEFTDTGDGVAVRGLYWWEVKKLLIAVTDVKVYSIDADGTATDITGAAPRGVGKVAFTDNGDTLVIADGSVNMLTFEIGGTTTAITDPDVPTDITSLGYLDGYILAAGNDSNEFYASVLDFPSDWVALGVGVAGGNPDNILAMNVAWREILLVGSKTVEVWYNDGGDPDFPFARKTSAYTERGMSARGTLVAADNTWFWLDNFRRFVRLDGATPKIVSTPFDKLVANMGTVADAFSMLMEVDGRNFILITFPTEKKTLVYDYMRRTWAEWSYWDTGLALRNRYRGNCSAYAPPWGKWFVGDMSNGKIYEVDPDTYDDDGDDIRFERRTGHSNHGTLQMKRSNELIIQVKRGTGNDNVTEPQLMVKWRNENGLWSNEHWLSLGKIGENEFIARLHRLGMYRSRQYSIVHTDRSAFTLVAGEEDVEVMSNVPQA